MSEINTATIFIAREMLDAGVEQLMSAIVRCETPDVTVAKIYAAMLAIQAEIAEAQAVSQVLRDMDRLN